MKKRGNRKKKRIVFAIVNGALLLIMAACLITTAILSNTLASQKEASRWRGESDMEFSQISCFIPVDEKIGLEKVSAFRTKLTEELHKAALDIDNDSTLFVDAWSCTGKSAKECIVEHTLLEIKSCCGMRRWTSRMS